MEKCKYYNDTTTMWGHGLCFAQKETPPCFSNGNDADCRAEDSIMPISVEAPPQEVFAVVDMRAIINWIRNCRNIKELKQIKMEISNAIIHFNDPEDDDDFRSRA